MCCPGWPAALLAQGLSARDAAAAAAYLHGLAARLAAAGIGSGPPRARTAGPTR